MKRRLGRGGEGKEVLKAQKENDVVGSPVLTVCYNQSPII